MGNEFSGLSEIEIINYYLPLCVKIGMKVSGYEIIGYQRSDVVSELQIKLIEVSRKIVNGEVIIKKNITAFVTNALNKKCIDIIRKITTAKKHFAGNIEMFEDIGFLPKEKLIEFSNKKGEIKIIFDGEDILNLSVEDNLKMSFYLYAKGFRIEEISLLMKINISTVKNWIYKIRDMIIEKYSNHLLTTDDGIELMKNFLLNDIDLFFIKRKEK